MKTAFKAIIFAGGAFVALNALAVNSDNPKDQYVAGDSKEVEATSSTRTATPDGPASTIANTDMITVRIPGSDASFNMVRVRAGVFEMGATPEQLSTENDEKPVHWVRLSEDFYIGQTEVTQDVYEAVMGTNPSSFKNPSNPVETISWADAQRFINRLNSVTGMTFSMPTEAQWEYAARGGHSSELYRFSGSADVDSVGWYRGNSKNRPHPVASLAPNEIGIYDMSGNVWEMCLDYKGKYPDGTVTDPVETKRSTNRVRRGGAWDSEDAAELRNAYRRRIIENDAHMGTGLRLVINGI